MVQRRANPCIKDAPPPMSWEEYEELVRTKWNELLSSETTDEPKIQEFLEEHPSLLPGAFGLFGSGHYPLGHYPFPCAVISQPTLQGISLKNPDFLWIATDSKSVYPTFIELEAPTKRWFTKKGKQADELTQAYNQIVEWKAWFSKPQNILTFIEFYQFPDWLRGRTLKPLYILIYGRREEANKHIEKRPHLDGENVYSMTYDRLSPDPKFDEFMTVRITQNGYEAVAIPPTLRLHSHTAHILAIIKNKEKAVQKNPYISKKRKDFLIHRIPYWDNLVQSGAEITIPCWE